MQRLSVSVSILGEIKVQVWGVHIADRFEQSVCFCVTKRVVSFILNLQCPLKRIVLLHEV